MVGVSSASREKMATFVDGFQKNTIRNYIRNASGNPIGVIVAIKDESDKVRIGWSKCNTKLDSPDKLFGLFVAYRRASLAANPKDTYCLDKAPKAIAKKFPIFLNRAEKYFKVKLVKKKK